MCSWHTWGTTLLLFMHVKQWKRRFYCKILWSFFDYLRLSFILLFLTYLTCVERPAKHPDVLIANTTLNIAKEKQVLIERCRFACNFVPVVSSEKQYFVPNFKLNSFRKNRNVVFSSNLKLPIFIKISCFLDVYTDRFTTA